MIRFRRYTKLCIAVGIISTPFLILITHTLYSLSDLDEFEDYEVLGRHGDPELPFTNRKF